jgi:hypothetical protein
MENAGNRGGDTNPVAEKEAEFHRQQASSDQGPPRHWSLTVVIIIVGGLATIAGLVRPVVNPPHDIWVVAFGIACVVIGIAVGLHEFFRNWGKTIVTGVIALILLVVIVADKWTRDFWLTHGSEPSAQVSVAAQATPSPNTQPQLSQPTFPEGSDILYFHCAGFTVVVPRAMLESGPMKPLAKVFAIGDSSALPDITLFLENNRMYVDAEIFSAPNGEILIKHNTLVYWPPNWDHNSNQSALEFVDDGLNPVFQLIFKSTSEAAINGVFALPKGAGVIVPLVTAV